MATKFWVGGTGTWDDSTTTHWSTTSGGTGGSAAPTSSDDVIFDNNSLTVGQTCTRTGTNTINSLTSQSSMSATATLITNALTVTGAVTWGYGVLNTNNGAQSWGSFNSSNSNGRTLTFGSSSITVTGSGQSWNCSISTNITYTTNTATVTLTGSGAGFNSNNANVNGLSIVYSGGGAMTWPQGLRGLQNLTITGTASKTNQLTISAGLTMNSGGTLTLGGNSTQGVNRLLVQTNSRGVQHAWGLSGCGIVIQGDVDFVDFTVTGSPSWTNSGNAFIGDGGGNGSIITSNETPSATQTSTGTASFTWSTHGWTSRIPLPQDDVVINNAFSASQTVTFDMPRLGKNITFSCTGAPTLANASGINYSVYGSIDFSGIGTMSANNSLSLMGRSTYNITTGGVTVKMPITTGCPSGTYTLQDNLTATSTINNAGGTFVSNGFTVNCPAIQSNSGNGQNLNLNGSAVHLTGTGVILNMNFNANQFSMDTATIYVDNTSSAAKTVNCVVLFSVPAHRYIGNVVVAPGAGKVTFNSNGSGGGNAQIGNLTAIDVPIAFTFDTAGVSWNIAGAWKIGSTTGPNTVTFANTHTYSVVSGGSLSIIGANGCQMMMRSSTPGTAYSISSPTPIPLINVDCQDCTASNKAIVIRKGKDSTGNTNVLFTGGQLASMGVG